MSAVRRGALAALALCGCLLAALWVPTTTGALVGTVRNTTNTAASGIWLGPCGLAAQRPGTALFAWPLDETTGPVARDVSGSARAGAYSGSVAYGAAGPCAGDGGRAVTVTGGATPGLVSLAAQQTNPQTFTAAVWFRTTSTTGGKLIGFGSSQTGPSGSYDRHLYLTNTGVLYAGVYTAIGTATNATTRTVSTGTTTYRDDHWHLAVMTLAPVTDANPGLRLYVDGGAPVVDTATLAAQVFNGYWRVGYDNLTSWPMAPSSPGFTGSLAFAQVYTSALTPAQVTALWNAGR